MFRIQFCPNQPLPLKSILPYSLLFLGFPALLAQEIPEKGVPLLENYVPSQYFNHGKIWDMASAPNGILYMAGDGGLLEFDGHTWSAYKGSNGFMRSVHIASDSVIYSGSDLDFGVWKRNALLRWEYASLYPFNKDPNEENEEFWDVRQVGDKIVFVSFSNMYVYRNAQLTKIAAPNRFSGSFTAGERLYLADEKDGLFLFNGMSLKRVFSYPDKAPFPITGVFATSEGLMIVTRNRGLFRYESGRIVPAPSRVSNALIKDQVFCSVRINDQYTAFGTILNGLYITDFQGNIIQHIDKQKGLSNNTILSMHYSPNGMLWLGMDYGISALHIHSGTTYFFDFKGAFGTASSALLKDGVFYLGTNQGLYQAAWERLDNQTDEDFPFSLVKGSEGQVWSLTEIGGNLFCGHDRGLFTVGETGFRQVHDEPGVWTAVPFLEDYLLTGNYNGISAFKKTDNGYAFLKKLELILGSCNQLLFERGDILWVNIPNFGLIRFVLRSDLSIHDRVIFPSSLFSGNAPFLRKDPKGGIHLLTSERLYVFNPAQKKFIPGEVQRAPGSIMGLLSGIYEPIPITDGYQFYPIHNGFALDNRRVSAQEKPAAYRLLVRNIEVFNNHGRQAIAANTPIAFNQNNLRVTFGIPHQHQAEYQYQLQGFSRQWSPWTAERTIEFLNLKEGSYTLKLRAKAHGATTPVSEVSFAVLPPWYRTRLAYAGYLLVLALAYFLNRVWHQRQLGKQRARLLEQEQMALRKQADKYEQEAVELKQQQLEKEKNLLQHQIKQKNIELAKQAKENEDKNRLLHILKEKMDQIPLNTPVSKGHWTEMKRILDMYLETEDHTFEIQIDELHQEFFTKLRAQFPDLSLYDLRLCAYLKIGLNSKEISDIMKVLPSSINVSRSRLRKKLNLLPDQDLYRVLNDLSNPAE
ncbi:MAG: hypothetical protein KIPDCIKN_03500 [Haliscomenobacter sp.]|nr:hypothetical protein [Haliscomenobacter sp.]